MSVTGITVNMPSLFNSAYQLAGKPTGLKENEASIVTIDKKLEELKQQSSDPNAHKNVRAVYAAFYMALQNVKDHFTDIDMEDGKKDDKVTVDNVKNYNQEELAKVNDTNIQFAGQEALDWMPDSLQILYDS